ncbi:MAG: hypothetical protein ACAI43_09750 [Phycisphaerae bacterium]|nr:hypothetical protein [Tepidisphaeraceae bacterium]
MRGSKTFVAFALGASLLAGSAWADEPAVNQSAAAGADAPVSATIEPLSLTADPLHMAVAPGGPAAEKYKGGRGMITLQGMSGMFLNPTSGTLDQGQLTIQYCLFVNDYDTGTVVGHGVMAAYGVTDALEVGWFGTVAEIEGVNRSWCDHPIGVTGPFARFRLLKDEGKWQPELSIGGIWLDGNGPSEDGPGGDLVARTEVFVAASKRWEIDRDGPVKSVRGHLGVRYISRHEAPDLPKSVRMGTDLTTAYAGIELELPYSIFFVAELATPDLFSSDQHEGWPYAVGFQWKPNNVLGLSIAHMNPEDLGLKDGFWFGIGLNFKF